MLRSLLVHFLLLLGLSLGQVPVQITDVPGQFYQTGQFEVLEEAVSCFTGPPRKQNFLRRTVAFATPFARPPQVTLIFTQTYTNNTLTSADVSV